jgi:hypothetical protein
MILPGQSIKFEWVANYPGVYVGPNDQASTHVIGAIFDRVWYEGNPRNEMRGMQTVLIGSSNGAVLSSSCPRKDATSWSITSSRMPRRARSDRLSARRRAAR